MQLQEPAPFCSRHTAFGPQGEGAHGVGRSDGIGGAGGRRKNIIRKASPQSVGFGVAALTVNGAKSERIAGVAGETVAVRSMTDNSAHGVTAARTGTRIATFLIDARQVARAFRITDAFRSAVWRRSHEAR